MRVPIRTRLTLVTALSFAVVLAIGSVALYLRFRADLLEAVDAGLRSRAEAVVADLGAGGDPVGGSAGLVEPEDAFAQVLAADGSVLASSLGLAGDALLTLGEVDALAGPAFLDRDVAAAEEVVPARLLAVTTADGRVVVVGASLEDRHEALARLAALLALGGPLILAVITAIAWVMTGAALKPIEAMRREAASIGATQAGRRLPVPDTGDEVARLAETLNDMLGRLEAALERERRFAADASHELRTPLANLRAELELSLRRSRSTEELEATVRSAAEESERLSQLAEDLLVLARADGGRLPVHLEPTDLDSLVDTTLGAVRPRAAERRIAVETNVPHDVQAQLDAMRVGQALGNLLENALRHTPAGGRIGVHATAVNGSVRIEVWDTGPGFPAAFLPHAFEPFARPDAARARDDGGTGLGLAIVRAIAESHGGSVEAANRPAGGASVVLQLPS